jgi:DNA-binding Lrp family transcriptional regulator
MRRTPALPTPGKDPRYRPGDNALSFPPATPPYGDRQSVHQEATMRAIFVQIKCDMGQAYRVAREAADTIPEMSELFSTSGQYDLLGKFYLEADQDIGLFVTEKVQTLPGVKDTYTLIAFNAFGGVSRR